MSEEPTTQPTNPVESMGLLDFLDVVTDIDVVYRPKRIIVPPKHHDEYRDWYRKFVNSYRDADLSTYNCVMSELSIEVRRISVVYDDIEKTNDNNEGQVPRKETHG